MLPGFASSATSASAAMLNVDRKPVRIFSISTTGLRLGVPPPKNTVSTLRPPTASRQSDASLVNVSAYDGIMCSWPAYELKAQ